MDAGFHCPLKIAAACSGSTLPPETITATPRPVSHLAREHRSRRRCARRLARELRALVEETHPFGDLVLGHEDGLDLAAADLEREVAGERRREPVGDRVGLDAHAVAGREARGEGLRALGRDADDARAPVERRDDARDQAAAAGADDDCLDVRHVLEQLERERPVAGDDERIGVRVDEDAPLLLDDLEHAVVGGGGIGRREVDGRAVAARRLDLERAHALPHLDEAVDALLGGRPRDGLRVVPRRPRDDAALPLLRRERREPVERAARLERARLLEQLRLERDAEGARAEGGRAVDPSGEDGRAPARRPLEITLTQAVSRARPPSGRGGAR